LRAAGALAGAFRGAAFLACPELFRGAAFRATAFRLGAALRATVFFRGAAVFLAAFRVTLRPAAFRAAFLAGFRLAPAFLPAAFRPLPVAFRLAMKDP
jgi:hypothetical protein